MGAPSTSDNDDGSPVHVVSEHRDSVGLGMQSAGLPSEDYSFDDDEFVR